MVVDPKLVDKVRRLKAGGLSIAGISDAIDLEVDEVKQILKAIYSEADIKQMCMEAIDEYSTTINEITMFIKDLRDFEEEQMFVREFMDALKLKAIVQEKKATLLQGLLGSEEFKPSESSQLSLGVFGTPEISLKKKKKKKKKKFKGKIIRTAG